MKSKHKSDHNHSAGPHLVPVTFEFNNPTAVTVAIAGTFNDWHPEAKPMHPMGDGRWLKETALACGTYEYCLVVDGKYIPDPQARETVANPFGGINSILKVVNLPESAHLLSAEIAPLKNANKQNRQKI